MRLSSFTSLLLILALGAVPNYGRSQNVTQRGVTAGQAPEMAASSVRTWLTRIHDAAGRYDFHGTLVVSAGGGVHSAHIVNVCNGGERYERIDTLDGQTRQIFRQRHVVHTFWPDLRVVQIEQRDELPDFPALVQGGADRIASYYELRSLGIDRVAGLEADVLLLAPRDDARYAHRLWAERKTGLLLRAEILGAREEVLESSAFSELVLGSGLSEKGLIKSMPKVAGMRVIRKQARPINLENEGWALQALVPGFQQVSSVKRPVPGGRQEGAPSRSVLQVVFSDGMTYVSIFIEPIDASKDQQPLQTSMGATQTLMQRQGDWWITVMGDVPIVTLQRFYAALERKH